MVLIMSGSNMYLDIDGGPNMTLAFFTQVMDFSCCFQLEWILQ